MINGKIATSLNLNAKRGNQKALQFWRVVNRVFWYSSARPPKVRGPGHLSALPSG